MKTYPVLSAIFLIAAFASCENEIPFNIKDNEPKLIVNAMIDIDAEENYIILAKTGRYYIDTVWTATVNIYINEELREQLTEPTPGTYIQTEDTLIYDNFDNNRRYKTALRFHPGDRVKIEVFADDKYHAWAEDIVPKPLEIERIDTVTYERDNVIWMRLKTTFTDFAGEKNFYRLALIAKNTLHYKAIDGILPPPVSYEQTLSLETGEDMVLSDGHISNDSELFPPAENTYAVFDDTRLHGDSYTMTTSFRPMIYYGGYGSDNLYGGGIDRVSVDFNIYLISITEMYYYYLKALNILDSDDFDEYFSTPVSLPSNVKGGIGFVGFSAGTHTTFSIPDLVSYYPPV